MSIREEWHDFYRFTWKDGLTPDMIEDWWITTLKERIEANRKNPEQAPSWDTQYQAESYNAALDTITRLLE